VYVCECMYVCTVCVCVCVRLDEKMVRVGKCRSSISSQYWVLLFAIVFVELVNRTISPLQFYLFDRRGG
jgi:hypothetical protein